MMKWVGAWLLVSGAAFAQTASKPGEFDKGVFGTGIEYSWGYDHGGPPIGLGQGNNLTDAQRAELDKKGLSDGSFDFTCGSNKDCSPINEFHYNAKTGLISPLHVVIVNGGSAGINTDGSYTFIPNKK